MTMPYLIWTVDYSHAQAGLKVLHRLCHELNAAGQVAYVSCQRTNPAWKTAHREPPLDGEWIAVYPEVVTGNPWNAPHVARYVLNNPGKLGGDKVYDPSEVVFVYSELFNDIGVGPERLLYLPTVETEIYVDDGVERTCPMYYVGKGRKTRELEALEVTLAMRLDRYDLAYALNRATVLYTFDNMTGMVDIARLCGCPVVVIPNGEYTREQYGEHVGWNGIGWDEMPAYFDPVAFRRAYLESYEPFAGQLATFIDITQAVGVAA
jgi:hypothetical protein